MEKQLSFELKILSSGKQENSSLKKHLSSKKEKKPKQKNQERQLVTQLLPKIKEELKLKSLSLENKTQEGQLSEVRTLEEKASELKTPVENLSNRDLLFDNQIHLISVKTVAEMLGIAPKTIHNWVYLHKIPYVKCGQKVMFRPKSLKAWLSRKEIKSWL